MTPLRLSEAEYASLLAASPPHRPLIEALQYGVLLLPIQPGAKVANPRDVHAPWVALVGDDRDRSQGPGAFNRPGLRRLARAASGVIVYSGAAEERFYLAAAGIALLGGRVLMVETQIPHHAAWHDAVRGWAPKTPYLDVSPIGGRA